MRQFVNLEDADHVCDISIYIAHTFPHPQLHTHLHTPNPPAPRPGGGGCVVVVVGERMLVANVYTPVY